jgi:hypothetical protein
VRREKKQYRFSGGGKRQKAGGLVAGERPAQELPISARDNLMLL